MTLPAPTGTTRLAIHIDVPNEMIDPTSSVLLAHLPANDLGSALESYGMEWAGGPGRHVVYPAGIGMTLHFEDADPVATCRTANCRQHFHGDSVNDAVLAWTAHLAADHRSDWNDS